MVQTARAALKRVVRKGTGLHRLAESVHRALWRHAPTLFAWRTSTQRIDVDITTRCNLQCPNCNRAIGVAPSDELLSVEQLARFVDESLGLRWRWRVIRLVGGEPTLHPQLSAILDAVHQYKDAHPSCVVLVSTNGYGTAVRRVLAALPRWVETSNSGKSSNVNRFQSYNVAPVDVARLRDSDFARGCFVTEYCGMALTPNGLYCCAPGAAVDRVFGFDVGARSLAAITPDLFDKQRRCLCRYCGHFKYNYAEPWVTDGRVSPAWDGALERYRRKRPVLTPF
jgi:hypothetical protein